MCSLNSECSTTPSLIFSPPPSFYSPPIRPPPDTWRHSSLPPQILGPPPRPPPEIEDFGDFFEDDVSDYDYSSADEDGSNDSHEDYSTTLLGPREFVNLELSYIIEDQNWSDELSESTSFLFKQQVATQSEYLTGIFDPERFKDIIISDWSIDFSFNFEPFEYQRARRNVDKIIRVLVSIRIYGFDGIEEALEDEDMLIEHYLDLIQAVILEDETNLQISEIELITKCNAKQAIIQCQVK